MSKKKKNISEEAKQDYVTNKLLSVFTIAFVMILGVMYCSQSFGDYRAMLAVWEAVKVLVWVLFALTAVFTIISIIQKIKGKTQKYKLITAKHLAVVFGFITICVGALANGFNDHTFNTLYVFIPAVTVLFIIFHTYPRDFFAISVIAVFGGVGIWLTGEALTGGMGASKLSYIIGFVLAVLAILTVAVIVIQANHGALWRKGKEFFAKGSKYWMIYLTIAVVVALLAATWFMVGAASYYFLFILLAYYLVLGIYFTVKLI